MEKSKALVELFNELINSTKTKKTIHLTKKYNDRANDGMRTVIDEEKNLRITLEKNASGYFISDDKLVFPAAGEDKQHEQTCIKFDKLPGVETI